MLSRALSHVIDHSLSMSVSASPVYFAVYALVAVGVLKEVNVQVREAYMDEPFHVGQAEAYCRGEWTRWDEKITTPAGMRVRSLSSVRRADTRLPPDMSSASSCSDCSCSSALSHISGSQ